MHSNKYIVMESHFQGLFERTGFNHKHSFSESLLYYASLFQSESRKGFLVEAADYGLSFCLIKKVWFGLFNWLWDGLSLSKDQQLNGFYGFTHNTEVGQEALSFTRHRDNSLKVAINAQCSL